MKREIITPDNREHWLELRSKDITSTDVAVLFGCSPYKTLFELWHEKAGGHVMPFTDNERMKWGGVLEAAIAQAVAQEENLMIRPMKEYIRLSDLRIGSSFDFAIKGKHPDDGFPCPINSEPDIALLEIKNVDSLMFKNGWLIDGDGLIEAPLHIELQMQNEMLVSGLNRCETRALVGGNTLMRISRNADESVQSAIKEKVAAFWDSIARNDPPAPDFEKDADFIRSMYSFAQPGTVADVSQDERMMELATAYREASEHIKLFEGRKSAAKSEMLMMIGEYEKAHGAGFKISAGMIAPTTVETYERAGYRDFRIFWPKEKKK